MKLNNFALIGSPGFRTYFYLKLLRENRISFNKIVIYNSAKHFSIEKYLGLKFNFNGFEMVLDKDFDDLVKLSGAESVEEKGFNELSGKIEKMEEDFIIFSGSGGEILEKKIFDTGKRFVHLHPGILPRFRGSTTVYYSILKEKCCGVTAFFMNEKIDAGEIIKKKIYPLPTAQFSNIDFIYDPLIRADLLVEILNDYNKNEKIKIQEQEDSDIKYYYIIHPVLKHLSMKKTGQI